MVAFESHILADRLDRNQVYTTLCGLIPPARDSCTIAEYNLALITASPKSPFLSRFDQRSMALICDQNGLRFRPVQLPKSSSQSADDDPTHFQPLFSVDKDGDPIVLPSSAITTEALFCWHTNLPWLAVILESGSLYLYDVNACSWLRPIMQHDRQKTARDMQFCPNHGNIIAVLCPTHVCLWQLAQGGKSASLEVLRPSDWKESIPDRGRGSVSFDPSGRYLAFVHEGQPSVAIWDLSAISEDKNHASLSHRLENLCQVCWSPNGHFLVALSSFSSHFYLWDATTWECIRWSTGASPGSSLIWHREQDLFLMAPVSSSVLHSVRVCPVDCSTDLDVGPVSTDASSGGNIREMAWSPDCKRLAISFTTELDDSTMTSSDLIAILATNVKVDERIRFTPVGFIRGPPSRQSYSLNSPCRMQFRPDFSEGALLAVLWSQGQITLYPLLYASTPSNLVELKSRPHPVVGGDHLNNSMPLMRPNDLAPPDYMLDS